MPSSSSSLQQESSFALEGRVFIAIIELENGNGFCKNVSIFKYQLDRNGIVFNVVGVDPTSKEAWLIQEVHNRKKWKDFSSKQNDLNQSAEQKEESLRDEENREIPRKDLTIPTDNSGVSTIPDAQKMMTQQSFLNACQTKILSEESNNTLEQSSEEESDIEEEDISSVRCSSRPPALKEQTFITDETLPGSGKTMDQQRSSNASQTHISSEKAFDSPEKLFSVDEQLSSIPFKQILEGNMEILNDDEENEGEDGKENDVVAEDVSSAGCSYSQMISKEQTLVTDEQITFLYDRMEHTQFESEEYESLQKLKCRTFMKLKNPYLVLDTKSLEMCLNSAINITRAKCDGKKYDKIMEIGIHHPALDYGCDFYEVQNYDTFTAESLIELFAAYRSANSKFAVDGRFRIQIDIVDAGPRKFVFGKQSLLKAIGIAQAYQNKINSDDEEADRIFEKMKSSMAQMRVANFLRKALKISRENAEMNSDILPTIVQYFSKTRFYVFSRTDVTVYNKNASEFILLDEDDGVFDFSIRKKCL